MDISDVKIDELLGEVSSILSASEKKRGVVITSLHKIQEEHGFLPEDVLAEFADSVGLSLAEIYSVASFYKQFHFTPRGKKIVRVCMGTACHVRGASKVVESLEDSFKINAGETTEDLKMTLETVGCVGCCGLAPVVTVNDAVLGAVGPKETKQLIKEIEEEEVEPADVSDNGNGNGKGDGE